MCDYHNIFKNSSYSIAVASRSKKNLDALWEATATLAQAADNVWLRRHAFDAYRQLPDQTFKQFAAEIVKLASLCQFDKDFCDANKIRVVDQLL